MDYSKFIKRINAKMRSYDRPDLFGSHNDLIVGIQNERLEALSSFEVTFFDKTTDFQNNIDIGYTKSGVAYIKNTKENRAALERAERMQAMRREKKGIQHYDADGNLVNKSIIEQFESIPTLDKRLKQIEKQIKSNDITNANSDVSIAPVPRITSKDRKDPQVLEAKKRDIETRKAYNRQQSIDEMISRALMQYDTSFGEDIEKLYEDKDKYSDLIERLNRSERWTGELMEEVHLAALGITPESRF